MDRGDTETLLKTGSQRIRLSTSDLTSWPLHWPDTDHDSTAGAQERKCRCWWSLWFVGLLQAHQTRLQRHRARRFLQLQTSVEDRDAEPEPEPEPTDFGRSRSRSRSRRNGLPGAGAGVGAVKNGAAPAPKGGTIVARKNKTKAK